MTTKKQLVDATDILLRLHCKCGAAISVVPATMKLTVFYCTNCGGSWPGAVGDENGVPRIPAERLAVALRDLQNEATKEADDSPRYRVQFEILS